MGLREARSRGVQPIEARVDVECLFAGAHECPAPADVLIEWVPRLRAIRARQSDVHVERCRACGRRVQGRHPLQASDALGAAAFQIGSNALALAAHLNKAGGVPYGRVVACLLAAFEIKMCVGGLARATHRRADRLEPTYQGFLLALRESPVVYAEATSMRASRLRG